MGKSLGDWIRTGVLFQCLLASWCRYLWCNTAHGLVEAGASQRKTPNLKTKGGIPKRLCVPRQLCLGAVPAGSPSDASLGVS